MNEFEPIEAELLEPVEPEKVIRVDIDRRDYFAGMALQGILANPTTCDYSAGVCLGKITAHAVILADALVEDLQEG